ncbi:MAG: hypothetical protein MJ000_09865 [Bacteroidales bacterium]|nr:hypothetical protein [Bacteroidales bacterium]
MNISEQDFKYMVEGATADLIRLLIERKDYDMKSAVDAVYQSETYAALNRPQTGLYYQSSGYLFDYLLEELGVRA